MCKCIWRWLVGLTLLLSAVACIEPRAPLVTPQVARVQAVSPTGLDLDLRLRVDNPNDFALDVESVSGDVYLGASNQPVGRSVATPRQSIPAKGAALLDSRLLMGWQQLPALTQLVGKTFVPFSVQGRVRLGNGTWKIELPFTMEGQVSTQQLLAAGLRGLPAGLPRLQ